MSWPSIFAVAVALAMDALAVAIVAGLTVPRVTPRHTFRLAFHFGLFQFLMPVLGWLAGRQLAARIARFDHWAAFTLLTLVGVKMLLDARGEEKPDAADPTRGLMLVTLSVATSIDALAVGLSMALLQVDVWVPAVVIGLVAAGMTTMGIYFGARLGPRLGHWARLAGGCVLLGIGVRILLSHLGG